MLARTAFRPRKQNSRRADFDRRAPGYLQWIRGRNCVLADSPGHACDGKITAAHDDYAGGKGMGLKVADRFAVPMCGGPAGAHAEQHRIGWVTFEHTYRINALPLANAFWNAWPGRKAWEDARG